MDRPLQCPTHTRHAIALTLLLCDQQPNAHIGRVSRCIPRFTPCPPSSHLPCPLCPPPLPPPSTHPLLFLPSSSTPSPCVPRGEVRLHAVTLEPCSARICSRRRHRSRGVPPGLELQREAFPYCPLLLLLTLCPPQAALPTAAAAATAANSYFPFQI